jgi:AcrR family transcriptional regulator
MRATADSVRATDGREPGRRGLATRGRLLECTQSLLTKSSYRDIKVIDIAREAGTSPATFYQYFPDVEHAVLVLAEQLSADAAPLGDLARGDWRGDRGVAKARAVVTGFMDYWEQRRAVFRVVDLATEEGDLRFRQLRTRALQGFTESLAVAVSICQPDLDATATAFVLVSMLAHAAAHRYGFEFWGVRTAAINDTLTRIVFTTITGRRFPA